MQRYFGLIYWSVMIGVMSLIFSSIMKSFDQAFFLSVMLMPGVLFVKYFSEDISFKNRRLGILHTFYFGAATLLIEYQCIMLVYWVIYGFSLPKNPEIILNPVFILFILASLFSIEKLLKLKFIPAPPEEQYITFTSERNRTSLPLDSITHIVSRDYEVIVMTVSGKCYPTRMKISQWEAVLDQRFLRVHRSFIVNRRYITRFDSHAVYLGDLPIEISRKYKETVLRRLG